MKKTVTLRVSAQPAFDMHWLLASEVASEESNVSREELLRGFNIAEEDFQDFIWVPVDLSDSDYAEFKELGVKKPDFVPVRCGCCFGGVVTFHATTDSFDCDGIDVEFDFGDISVHTNGFTSWWIAEQRKRGYAA